MKANKNSRSGFTLVEVVVSGALLIMFSLMMAQGFSVCSHLLLRSSQKRAADESLEEAAALGESSDRMEAVSLEIGEYGTWDVEIYTYEAQAGDSGTSFQILRKIDYEK